MARCRKCGKKGLFLSVDSQGLCASCAAAAQKEKEEARVFLAKVEQDNKARQAKFDEQNKVLAIYNAANEQYKKDKDINALIAAYEKAFVDSGIKWTHGGTIKLANLYIKTDQHDKAWGYLNSLSLYDPLNLDFLSEIRLTQAKLLKKEKRYIPAIEMTMLGYLDEINQYRPFKKDKFENDIKTMAQKMNWDDEKIQKIEEIIVSSATSINRESTASKQFREACKAWK